MQRPLLVVDLTDLRRRWSLLFVDVDILAQLAGQAATPDALLRALDNAATTAGIGKILHT